MSKQYVGISLATRSQCVKYMAKDVRVSQPTILRISNKYEILAFRLIFGNL